jgi:HEAT repeat protein
MLVASMAGPPEGYGQGQVTAPDSRYRGRSFEEWSRDLQGGTPMIRERAVVALCEFGAPAVPLLVGAIGDHDFNVRTLAVFCLGRLGPKAKDAVPTLVKTLEDRDWIMRRYAAAALGTLEATAAESAPALARAAVEDSEAGVRQTAKFALARLGLEARETAKPILQQTSVSSSDEAVRTRALELLREMEKR